MGASSDLNHPFRPKQKRLRFGLGGGGRGRIGYLATTFAPKEENILFNDALNTFYLRLYGVGHIVKDNSDSERGNPLPPHGLLFLTNSKGYFICTVPQTG